MNSLKLPAPALVGVLVLCIQSISAVTLVQDFASDPLQAGWQALGESNLFHWSPTNQNLEVTWDSSKTNSYFCLPLGNVLAKDDDFSVQFDLRLDDIGSADTNLFSFEIAIGFLNLKQATAPGFLRGTGYSASNLVEFAYFRDDPYGSPATVYPTLIDRIGQFNYNYGKPESTNYVLAVSNVFRVAMTYTAADQTLVTTLTNLTAPDIVTVTQKLGLTFSGDPFADFRLDAVSINSYSEEGQYPGYEGSVLAHGVVDNLVITVPSSPVQNLTGAITNGFWRAQFDTRTNWLYWQERSTNFLTWSATSQTAPGNGTSLTLQDTNAIIGAAYYRIGADRP